MQIHELNSYSGTPGATDYLAIDDGSETMKVSADNLGVTTEMTQAEAEAGTVTDPRVVTPSVFLSAVNAIINTAVTNVIQPLINTAIAALSSVYVSITDPVVELDVVISSSTGYATSGDDMDLYNNLVDLGWVSDVIETS